MNRRPFFAAGMVLAIGSMVLSLSEVAEPAYPDRPIKMIVPWPAGGDTDIITRIFGNHLQKHLGQSVVASNVTGASGTMGAREAKASPPDGYTVYSVHDYLHGTYYVGITDINYWDFEPICRITFTPNLVGAHAKVKWNNMKELIADAKQRPGQIPFGITLGSTTHFFAAMIEHATGAKWRYVSYEGTAPRMTALLGGHIDLGRIDLTQLDKVRAGQLKLLGIATEQRHTAAPDVPTLKEQGINVIYGENRGLLVPKGTPEAAIAALDDACGKVAKESAFVQDMQKNGTEVHFLNRKAYSDFLKKNDALTRDVATALGILKRK